MSMKKLADAGPPKNKSNAYVLARLMGMCTVCEQCGEVGHYNGAKRQGFSQQTNISGLVLPVRRAVYMAAQQKQILKGRRITSKCKNPACINPKLLVQATPGQVIKADYVKGNRSRLTAAAHLQKFRKVLLTEAAVMAILADERGGKAAAGDYGISDVHFNSIKRGAARRTANPFAGLLA